MSAGPAYRVETERLVLRCFDPRDAHRLDEAIAASVDHLRPWMPWAHEEPKSLADRVERLRAFRASFDSGRDFIYGIFDPTETELWGTIGSHTRRGEGTREIGYWVRVDRVRNGLATEAAAGVAKVAFELGAVSRVEIRCDVDNDASRGIPKKLGFRLEGVLRQETQFLSSRRDSEVWSLVASEYAGSVASRARIKAFDAIGNALVV